MGIQQNMADMMRAIKRQRRQSMVEFSEDLEVSTSTLQEYLNARGNPTIKMVERLAQKMDLDPIALMSGIAEPDQRRIVLLLLDTIQDLACLPQEKRLRFAELFLELVQLWGEGE